jgi:hypothetical protein
MARIQLVLPDEDRDRFVHAANAEGVSLSEWLRLAARERGSECSVALYTSCEVLQELLHAYLPVSRYQRWMRRWN